MTNFTLRSIPPRVRHPEGKDLTHAELVESRMIRFALGGGGVAVIAAFVVTAGMRDVWVLGGDNLLSRMILYVALVVAITATPYAYIRGAIWRNSQMPANRQKNWRWRVIPVTISALFVNFLLVLIALVLIDRAFPNLAMSRWAAIITLGFVGGGITYLTGHIYFNLRAPTMLGICLAALFGTLLFAGAMHSDAQWFVQSFSHLGATDTNMSHLFNVGIIMAGILIVVWVHFLMDDLVVLEQKRLISPVGLRIIRYGLILVGILLSLVGATPWGISTLINVLHMIVAGGSGAVAGVLVIAVWWLLPWFPRWFYYAGYVMVVATVLVVILKLNDYVWLTGMQFAGFTVVAFWLLLFQRSSENLLLRVDPQTNLLSLHENLDENASSS